MLNEHRELKKKKAETPPVTIKVRDRGAQVNSYLEIVVDEQTK